MAPPDWTTRADRPHAGPAAAPATTLPAAPPAPPPALQAVLRCAVLRTLADLIGAGLAVAAPFSASSKEAGVLLTVTVSPLRHAPPPQREPTPCERDILAVLRSAYPERLTADRVLAALLNRNLLHGDSTVRKALAGLSRCGRVNARRSRPSGYQHIPGT